MSNPKEWDEETRGDASKFLEFIDDQLMDAIVSKFRHINFHLSVHKILIVIASTPEDWQAVKTQSPSPSIKPPVFIQSVSTPGAFILPLGYIPMVEVNIFDEQMDTK